MSPKSRQSIFFVRLLYRVGNLLFGVVSLGLDRPLPVATTFAKLVFSPLVSTASFLLQKTDGLFCEN